MKTLFTHALVVCFILFAAKSHAYDVKPSYVLSSLADDAKADRKLAGAVTALSGVGIGLINLSVSEDAVAESLLVGGVFAGLGAAYYFIPSNAEKAAERVALETNETAKEEKALSELIVLSEKARSARLIGGVAGIGLGFLFINHHQNNPYGDGTDLINGALFAGLGVSNLLFKSPAERALDRLNDHSESHAWIPSVQLALAPTDSAKPAAAVKLGWDF